MPAPRSASLGSTILAWWGAIIGTSILLACLTVAGVYIALLAQVSQDPRDALVIIGLLFVVGAVFGMLTLWYAARTYAKIVAAILSLTLVTGGLAMLVIAPVIRQMNTPELAEYRGFNALLFFGVMTTALGLALGALCVRWSMTRNARRRLARWSRLLGSAYGVLLGLSGVGVMLLMLMLINGEETVDTDGTTTSVVEQAIVVATIAMMSLVPGVILTYQGISASMGEGSGRFRAPFAAPVIVVYGAVLLAGQANMRMESPIALPMPLLHVLAAVLPGIALACMAARGGALRGHPVAGLTWRQVLLAAAISMTVATTIAIYVESIGAVFAVVLLLVHNGAFEFASNSADVFNVIDISALILTENEQFLAGFITAAILAPLSEEFGKSLSVRFMMRPATTRAQAFVLGAAAGAAFGFLESMLYGVSAISGDLSFWWAIMLIRGGSTSLHVICTGLAGVGWWYWSSAHRHRPALALFGLAVAIHAVWNGFFTLLDSRIFGLDTLSVSTLEVVAYIGVAAVSVAMIVAVPLIALRLREPAPPSAAGTPLESLTPWLA